MYVKVHAGVHGKHVILSISQKQVSTMTKCNESRLCRKFVQRTDYFVSNTLENNLHCTYNMTSTIENKEEKSSQRTQALVDRKFVLHVHDHTDFVQITLENSSSSRKFAVQKFVVNE